VLGQRINNFEIIRLLDEGGMGTVYEARHPLIGRRVAVKVLRRELALQEELVTRFFNEARATNAIGHPNIIEIIDVGRFPDGAPYLIMELLEGESLSERLRRVGRLEVAEAVELLQQTAGALGAAHEKGIVHRDLKPDHLFLTWDEQGSGRLRVKILDFGIAKLRGEQVVTSLRTSAGAIFGTPLYMPPEQCLGLPDLVDARADIYALGVILYEAICGRPPFVSKGWGDLLMMHMTQAPVPPSVHLPGLPAALEAVILKALEKKPELRHASMAEFARALAAATAAPRGSLGPPITLESFVERNTRPGPAPAQTAFGFSHPSAVTHLPPTERIEGGFEPFHSLAGDRAPSTAPPSSPFVRAVSRFRQRRAAIAGVAAAVVLAGAFALFASLERSPAKETMATLASAALAPRSSARERSSQSSTALPAPLPASPARASTSPARASTSPNQAVALLVDPKPRLAPILPVPAPAMAPDTLQTHRKPSRAPNEPAPERLPAEEPGPASADVGEPTTGAQPGLLNFDSDPWAKVFLDSKELGTTPLRQVSLPPGRHVLTLRNPELGISTTYVVNVPPGGKVSRFVGWSKQ
jgi:eukaryotic-like serine/threonine-protein kinase